MGERCSTAQYFDDLLSQCEPCKLRCHKPPPDCLSFCSGSTNSQVTHKEVPPTSAGASIIYKTEGSRGTLIEKDTNYVIWILVVLIVALVSTVVIVTFMLHRKRKLAAGSFGKTCGDIATKSSSKGADLEQASCDELKKPVAENEDVNNLAGVSIYDNVLSDYLFPLPAVEEGAAILVTTKTSACFNTDPGVRGDAFVEM
ncbi:tumor necrosis factor receptor superfamily member 17 [Eleutherodactylus coqui]|uniref:tumor necrosis factor receptor superfamily member 17 n=1 Tax=Eleutherodactylus coqui TaxID=57060 RepID=UPI0034619FD9